MPLKKETALSSLLNKIANLFSSGLSESVKFYIDKSTFQNEL